MSKRSLPDGSKFVRTNRSKTPFWQKATVNVCSAIRIIWNTRSDTILIHTGTVCRIWNRRPQRRRLARICFIRFLENHFLSVYVLSSLFSSGRQTFRVRRVPVCGEYRTRGVVGIAISIDAACDGFRRRFHLGSGEARSRQRPTVCCRNEGRDRVGRYRRDRAGGEGRPPKATAGERTGSRKRVRERLGGGARHIRAAQSFYRNRVLLLDNVAERKGICIIYIYVRTGI